MHAGEHVLGQAARGLDRLPVEQAVLDVLHGPADARLLEQRLELGPQVFLLAGRVVVEAAAGRAAVALELLDHALDQQLARRGLVGLAFGGKVGPGLVQHVDGQRQRGLVQHRQRAHRQADLHGGVLDHRRRNALAQHGRAFHHVRAEGAAGVEAPRIVHHDRQLAQRLHVVVGACHGLVVGLPAADDLHQLHLVHRAEEVDADKLLRPAAGLGQPADGQGGGVAGKEAALGQHGFGFLRDLRLQLALLEHGLDDEIAPLQRGCVGGGRDAVQQRLLVMRVHAALFDPRLRDLAAVGLAVLGLLRRHILQHRGDAATGLRVGDAGTHHAGAQDAHLLRLEARDVPGPRLAGLDGVQVEEEGVDHVLRHRPGHQAGEVTAFDARGGVVVHLRAFRHGGQRGLRGRVAPARLHLQHGRRHGQRTGDLRVGRRAAGHPVILGIPQMLGLRVLGDPGQGARAQVTLAAHQLVHHADLQRLVGAEQPAFHDVGLRAHQAQQAGELGDARTAGDQPQRQLWQAELQLGIVDRDAVVAHQRRLHATAQGAAIDAADHRDAQGLQRAEVLLDALDLGVDARRVGLGHAHHALQVGAGEEGLLGRSQDQALELVLVLQHLLGHGLQVVLPLQAHGVDGRALLVEGDGGDAPHGLVSDVITQGLELHGFYCFDSCLRPSIKRWRPIWSIKQWLRSKPHQRTPCTSLHRALALPPPVGEAEGAAGDSAGVTPSPRSSRFPCRRPRTAWPGRSAAGGGAARRSACPGSWRRWPPAGAPWQWRRR